MVASGIGRASKGKLMSQLNSPITALGYLGVQSNSLDAWAEYGTGFLGMQAGERSTDQIGFRMDDRSSRLTVHQSHSQSGIAYFGWEVADSVALARLAKTLEDAKVAVSPSTANLRAQRGVVDLISFTDPAGHRLEAFYGLEQAASPFVAGRSISGFRSGALGMGHAVLTVSNAQVLLKFYQQVLGFGLSDYIIHPFKAYFLHVNGRHHTLALIETGKAGVHHIMLEMLGLDDVGQAYDLALGIPDRIGTTLGRHTNDFMTSFYARSPSEFMVEIGWGGRVIDTDRWQAFEVTAGPSLWGHDRNWLPAEGRAQARELRLRVAAEGMRYPVQVLPGHFVEMPSP